MSRRALPVQQLGAPQPTSLPWLSILCVVRQSAINSHPAANRKNFPEVFIRFVWLRLVLAINAACYAETNW